MLASNTIPNTQPSPPPGSPISDDRKNAPSLWQELCDHPPPKKHVYLPDSVGSNCGIRCPEHTAVKVQIATGPVPIHANIIDFNSVRSAVSTSPNAQRNAREAIAGQSPQNFDLCEKFLVQGLDSGNGLFQFVSRKAHAFSCGRSKERSREVSIIDQLLVQWNGRGDGCPPLLLGGRYEVTAIEQLPPDKHHRRLILSVRDPNNPSNIINVPLTQAGLKFTGRVLGADEIEQANTLLTAHKRCLNRDTIGTAQWADDPLIASFAGIGRNAALIIYREICARLAALPAGKGCDARWLDANLFDVITTGRRDRGSKFIHSEEQLQELRKALLNQVQQHNQTQQRKRSLSPVTAPKRTRLFIEVTNPPSTPEAGASRIAKSAAILLEDQASPEAAKAPVEASVEQPVPPPVEATVDTPRERSVEVPVEEAREISVELPVEAPIEAPLAISVNAAVQATPAALPEKSIEAPAKTSAEESEKKSATGQPDQDGAALHSSKKQDAITNQNQQIRRLADQQRPTPETGAPRNAHAARQALFAGAGADATSARWLCDYNTLGTMNDRSVEQALTLPSDKTYDRHLNNLIKRLNKTHYIQEISAEHWNCWMRSAWLAVLASTPPDELAARLRANAPEICDPVVEDEVTVLTAISRLYHRDPAAFVHGNARKGGRLSKHAESAARLHPHGRLSDILPPSTGVIKENITTESFLRQLQLKLVAAYSSDENLLLIQELALLQREHQYASRDLPLMLHRSLGLPVLIIQTGVMSFKVKKVEQLNRSCEITVDVPKGTDLAAQLSGWVEHTLQPRQLDERINFLLDQFSNAPILYLHNNHYMLCMPNATAAPEPGDKQEGGWWNQLRFWE